MKNRILILILLALAVLLVQRRFYFQAKPIVQYSINNSFPVIEGDTVSIDFNFIAEYELKTFAAKIIIGSEILNEVVNFTPGNKNGNLNYSFIVPENCGYESMINLEFLVTDKFSSSSFFTTIPVYNPPTLVKNDLNMQEKTSNLLLKFFYSSSNLILKNVLLAQINEVEGYSDFKVDELNYFNALDYLKADEKKSFATRNIITSNLLEPTKELIFDKSNVAEASIFSFSIADKKQTQKNPNPVDVAKKTLKNVEKTEKNNENEKNSHLKYTAKTHLKGKNENKYQNTKTKNKIAQVSYSANETESKQFENLTVENFPHSKLSENEKSEAIENKMETIIFQETDLEAVRREHQSDIDILKQNEFGLVESKLIMK
jgi:hypothetical protein